MIKTERDKETARYRKRDKIDWSTNLADRDRDKKEGKEKKDGILSPGKVAETREEGKRR